MCRSWYFQHSPSYVSKAHTFEHFLVKLLQLQSNALLKMSLKVEWENSDWYKFVLSIGGWTQEETQTSPPWTLLLWCYGWREREWVWIRLRTWACSPWGGNVPSRNWKGERTVAPRGGGWGTKHWWKLSTTRWVLTEISLLASLDSTLYIKQLLFTVDICKLIHTLIALNCHCTTVFYFVPCNTVVLWFISRQPWCLIFAGMASFKLYLNGCNSVRRLEKSEKILFNFDQKIPLNTFSTTHLCYHV